MKSFYQCPACDSQLKIAIESTDGFDGFAQTTVFCSDPNCPSGVSRIGRKARTEAEAYKALCAAVEAEAEDLKDS